MCAQLSAPGTVVEPTEQFREVLPMSVAAILLLWWRYRRHPPPEN
jgi:hypothetical protein